MKGKLSKKAAALKYGVQRTPFRRYLRKCVDNRENIYWSSEVLEGAAKLISNYTINQIFSTEEEIQLSNYLQTITRLHHGLNSESARKLAFDLAVAITPDGTNHRTKNWKGICWKRSKEASRRIVSNVRGTLVTVCGAINAIDYMVKNAPSGTEGVASPSGWMTSELFVQWIMHFTRHARLTQASPILLIMDNHESHISMQRKITFIHKHS
ncbi:hypothetical protein ILUMI_21520 [Ignelater luminosus]|uniref:DDE-1 domain-containing protein n=1 Tax=Ignelater luminosus TaxID=2038154 RepID=A0A8K0CBY9_IGNLU|nr:hypothetical protein ILUMI_21520 [Ignelater luminosus]